MIPEDALQRIRWVNIHHYNSYIWGFSFFDIDGALPWKIGKNIDAEWMKKETVLLEENEVIVGVVAKLSPYCQSVYTDF